ncbi:MAG: hypothetical protein B7X02_01430 [Rhodospirillales bacterium 12-54-5]|nr:MAG: hypothetical protein B7X02_01430 [Rhodospirillales bacterium 12-54-5]
MAIIRKNGPKSARRKRVDAWVNRLFCKRSIIIVSEHKTQHIPFAVGAQMCGMLTALVVVGWASYSSGSYMAAQQVLHEKDKKIASASQENQRFAAEFGLLKRDLITLAQEEQKTGNGKSSDYAKMVADSYTKASAEQQKAVAIAGSSQAATAPIDPNAKYSAVFQRIDYLEAKMKNLQAEHDAMVADIKETTGGKIAELQRIIASTGVDASALVRTAELERTQNEQRLEKYGRIEKSIARGPQGGPFEPVKTSMLKDKEPELYFDLKKLMVMNDLVNSMPLSFPLDADDFRVTSTFGNRIDPFRGRLAFHSGVDIAGPEGVKILAPSDGKVVLSGWKTAYGNTLDIDHGNGFVTRYGHLSRALVRDGQTVRKGQAIAIQGATGRTTGSHLHYEVRYNDEPLNPGKFLKAGANVRAID